MGPIPNFQRSNTGLDVQVPRIGPYGVQYQTFRGLYCP